MVGFKHFNNAFGYNESIIGENQTKDENMPNFWFGGVSCEQLCIKLPQLQGNS